MNSLSVNPLDLRDVVKSLGWSLIPGISDNLYVFSNQKYVHRQIYFPKHNNAPDYAEAVSVALEKLSHIHEIEISKILSRLSNLRTDSISYRISTKQEDDFTLPLSFASAFIEAAELALLSAACTAIRPSNHHRRLSLTDATQLVRRSRLGQTDKGSFIFNISCPVEDIQGSLDLSTGKAKSLGREAMLITYNSVAGLVKALEDDTLEQLIETNKEAASPILSANFCDALVNMHDPEIGNDLEISLHWSPILPLPTTQGCLKKIRIQRDYFQRIEQVKQELKSCDPEREEIFYGTVEVLNGEMNDHGQRHGEVIVAVLLDNTVVRARAYLDAEQYATAVKCHTLDGHHVAIWGKILPGRQPRSLIDIVYFGELDAPRRN